MTALHRNPKICGLTITKRGNTDWYRTEKPPFLIEVNYRKGTWSGFLYWGPSKAQTLCVYFHANVEGEVELPRSGLYFTTSELALQYIEESLEDHIQEVIEGLNFWLNYKFKDCRTEENDS